jgi:hypothetical protein
MFSGIICISQTDVTVIINGHICFQLRLIAQKIVSTGTAAKRIQTLLFGVTLRHRDESRVRPSYFRCVIRHRGSIVRS